MVYLIGEFIQFIERIFKLNEYNNPNLILFLGKYKHIEKEKLISHVINYCESKKTKQIFRRIICSDAEKKMEIKKCKIKYPERLLYTEGYWKYKIKTSELMKSTEYDYMQISFYEHQNNKMFNSIIKYIEDKCNENIAFTLKIINEEFE